MYVKKLIFPSASDEKSFFTKESPPIFIEIIHSTGVYQVNSCPHLLKMASSTRKRVKYPDILNKNIDIIPKKITNPIVL